MHLYVGSSSTVGQSNILSATTSTFSTPGVSPISQQPSVLSSTSQVSMTTPSSVTMTTQSLPATQTTSAETEPQVAVPTQIKVIQICVGLSAVVDCCLVKYS